MASREKQRTRFLESTEWKHARIEAFSQDASFRQYFRLHGGPMPALLMDAPPEHESVAPFVTVARHLQSLSLSAPQIYQVDEANGFCVLEDFGDDTFTRLLADGHDERELYFLATDCLSALHKHPHAADIALPRREATFIDEVLLLCDWFYPAVVGADCPGAIRDAFALAWESVLSRRPDSTDVIVLRDFHVDNAMLLADRSGAKRCGLLDFQDATIGPAGYDLISLLEDARRDITPSLVDDCVRRYLENSTFAGERDNFLLDCAVLAAQRHTRVAGVFVRLSRRDHKHHYLHHLPRVVHLLRKNLQHPAMSPVADWFDEHCPLPDDPATLGRLTTPE